MAISRRALLRAGLGLAIGGSPGVSARAGLARLPAFLTAAREATGAYLLCGVDRVGTVLFSIGLKARGHDVACHPNRPEAVLFARRPGTFALVADCYSGRVAARLEAPAGRHFYGHGAFQCDGALLFTTENDMDTLQGRIGIWDVPAGYRRIGEVASGGIGPHDCLWHPGLGRLVVANGGMATHPDSGRTVLNLASMRPNLAYLDPRSGALDTVELDPALWRNSIRHLALGPGGMVVAAMQWQGSDGEAPPLLFTHRPGSAARMLLPPPAELRALRNYVGSVAVSGDGRQIMATSPVGGVALRFSAADGAFIDRLELADMCGLGADGSGFLVSSGAGGIGRLDSDGGMMLTQAPLSWDNHITAAPTSWG